MNLLEKIREQLNWSDPAYRIPLILFMFLFLIVAIFLLCFLPTPCPDDGQSTLLIYCFSALEPVMEEEILPEFQKYWLEKTGKDVRLIICYSSSGLISNRMMSRFRAQVVILASEMDAYLLSRTRIVNKEVWQVLPNGGKLCYSPVILYAKNELLPLDVSFQNLDYTKLKIAITDPATSGVGQWALLALYGSRLRAGNNAKDAFDYTSQACLNFSHIYMNSKLAFEKFAGDTTDILISYEAFGSYDIEDEASAPILVYPPSTIAAEPVVVPVSRNIWNGDSEVVEAFIQFLWNQKSQTALEDYGFKVHDKQGQINFQHASIQDLFGLDSLGQPELLLKEVVEPLLLLNKQGN